MGTTSREQKLRFIAMLASGTTGNCESNAVGNNKLLNLSGYFVFYLVFVSVFVLFHLPLELPQRASSRISGERDVSCFFEELVLVS